MTVRSAWLLTAPGGQTREDTRRAPIGAMTPVDAATVRSGVVPGGDPYTLTDTGAMTCDIGLGRAVIQGVLSQGAYGHVVTATESLTVTDGDASLDRIDSVFAVVYDNLYDATGMTLATIELVEGVPSSTPTAPNPPTQSALRLWDITVPAGTSAGTGGIDWVTGITDRRQYTVAVGGINPGGTSVAGAYVGQWRDNTGTLERWNGTSWEVRQPHDGVTFNADLLLGATTDVTWGGDTTLYRNAAGELRTGGSLIADGNFTVLMDWTPLTSLGSYTAGFSDGIPTPRMRKILLLGSEVWEFEGEISISSFTAGTAVTAFTFNAGHRVADTRGCHVFEKNGGFYGVRLALLSDGVMQLAAAGTPGAVLLDDVRITNPLAT